MKPSAIAAIAHEINRAYCHAMGDDSILPWNDAPDWQRQSSVNGVNFALTNPNAKPADSHESWMAEKVATGWKHGPVKNPEAKEHPCLVPYLELPVEQRAKDHLFLATVRQLANV